MRSLYIEYSDFIVLPTIPSFRLLIPKGENISDFEHLAFTLDSICLLFTPFFPLMEKKLSIALSRENYAPICLRDMQVILLNTDQISWCQAAYQFAHELCHYMIPNDVTTNMRWFEESICETASYFFLKNLTQLWIFNNIDIRSTDGNIYANEFSAYVDNDMRKLVPFNIKKPAEIKNLEHNCYQREKNSFIASLLLPIFSLYPETWCSISHLSSIPPDLCLTDALNYWDQLSGGNFRGIREIYELFSS